MKQYQHSKSGISLLEIMMNILFFALLATLCMQIFFKAYQIARKTTDLHQAVEVCTSIANICQSSADAYDTLVSVYPDSIQKEDEVQLYFDKAFLACGKKDASYCATVSFVQDTLPQIHIVLTEQNETEAIYELTAAVYQPQTIGALGGVQHE